MATKAANNLRAKLTARIAELSDLPQNKGYNLPDAKMVKSLTEPELAICAAILARAPDRADPTHYYTGVHTVYGQVNKAIREMFPGTSPVDVTNGLAAKGVVQVSFVKGGASIRFPGTAATIAAGKGKDQKAATISAAVRNLVG